MARSNLAVAVRELPAGASVCGWCAEFEDAARRASGLALDLDRAHSENRRLQASLERLTRYLDKRNSPEIERLRDELRYALRDSVYYREKAHPFRCPLCEWHPQDEVKLPMRSLRSHLRRAHGARSDGRRETDA